MKFVYSIRTILIAGFLAVMLPTLLFMMINHFYSRDIVRDKVTETYSNTLDIFVGQTDDNLDEITNYLLKMSILDVDVGMLMSFPTNDDMYTLTKIRIDTKLKRDVDIYNVIDSVFLYHEQDIIMGTNSEYNNMKDIIQTHMGERTASSASITDDVSRRWEVRFDQRMPGGFFLLNSIEVNAGLHVGALIRLKDINESLLTQWSDGVIGDTGIWLREEDRLKNRLTENEPPVDAGATRITNVSYQTLSSSDNGKSYLVMNRPSRVVPVAYQVIVPEQALLKELSFFRNVALFAPIGLVLILSLYLIFIRKMLFKPLQELIFGMRKISLGMLDVRLKRGKTIEFEFLGETFNKMAEQIKTLKIDVYEEQLRVKQGELRQLQSQINPHFYMNSLNIIYNLAALNDTESVKKMSLHLADYFRFIMRTNSDTITIREELSHIGNYITIQQIRFPDKLACAIEADEEVTKLPIPALTLQPFVENAIIHGFKNRRKTFHISITAATSEREGQPALTLTVADNGTGYDEAVLEQLRQKRYVPQGDSGGLGIMNVIDRLSILYGDRCSIEFYNSADGGAVVTISIPLQGGGA
ncbi:two-component sensor histidine kinase [Paenibacillus agaridevorans]|uniref:Two-component sensor histidine kinase n=1 Tax=Paenibacillus agaridevorans TaxID=171404 RepID=A0A2R5EX19_9BACL|nr:sensor histidine kinase [Paenibacillus agaridevorans]GBG11200.1 two-component sensor histidine kinase [Paenibacillus agaridevorans]